MTAKDLVAGFDRRRRAGELEDGLEHAVRRRQAAHGALAAELVPDLAVVRRRLLEEPRRRGGDVLYLQPRHHAPELRERVPLEIDAPRILGREVRFDPERRANALEHD